MLATIVGNLQIVRELLRAGADVNLDDAEVIQCSAISVYVEYYMVFTCLCMP